jgi:hypothetical protein
LPLGTGIIQLHIMFFFPMCLVSDTCQYQTLIIIGKKQQKWLNVTTGPHVSGTYQCWILTCVRHQTQRKKHMT